MRLFSSSPEKNDAADVGGGQCSPAPVSSACRQKRSMGLTVAEGELARLDQERVRDRVTLERERSYAENIITKIEDIL